MPRVSLLLVLISALLLPAEVRTQPVDGPTDSSGAANLDSTQIGKRIHRYLSAMETFGFSGAIVVSHQGEMVLREGYGLADRKTRRPYTPKTVQSHGSITKQMTAACILLLASRGELSVTDSITRYFDDLSPEKQGITLHHLLTHSSGLPGGIGPDEDPIDAETYVQRIMNEPLQFDPGMGYAYSNVGYALLGILVERVSGRGYEDFLRDELLLPAGIEDTGYLLPDWEEERLALGYRKGELWGLVQGRGWIEDGPSWHLRANGGLHTTVDDMLRWLDTLRGRGPLSTEAVERWTTGYVDEGAGHSHYAYGWVIRDSEWGPMIAHSGSNRIFSADFVWMPGREFFLYIQGNSAMVPARGQRERLLAAAFDPEFSMPPLVQAQQNPRPEVAAERVGIYGLGEGFLEVTADDTRLLAKLWGQSALDLFLQPTDEQRDWFAELSRRTQRAMEAVQAGKKDALAGMIREDADVVTATGELLGRIEEIGGLQKLHVIGTFENVPGSRLEKFGPWTTFVYAQFENWNQYWNLIWNEDGTYRGNASGPWPSFTLIPTSEGQYRAVQQGVPWHTADLRFEGSCLVSAAVRACRDE
jgi:CubicO group peptidase (beta-lactamase class C family)